MDHCSSVGMKMTEYPFLWSMTKSTPETEEARFSAISDGAGIMAFARDVPFNVLSQVGISDHPHSDRVRAGMSDDKISLFAREGFGCSFGFAIGEPIGGLAINAALLGTICMQCAAAESDGDIIEFGDGTALLDQDILFGGPATRCSVIYPLA